MELDDNFELKSDTYSWNLIENIKAKEGKDYYKVHGYHGRIEHALSHYIDLKFKKNCDTISEVIDLVRELREDINEAIKTGLEELVNSKSDTQKEAKKKVNKLRAQKAES